MMSELCLICGCHSLVVPVKRKQFGKIVIPEGSSNCRYIILPIFLDRTVLQPYSPEQHIHFFSASSVQCINMKLFFPVVVTFRVTAF